MKLLSRTCLSTVAGIGCAAASAMAAAALPITYTAFAITDVKLAGTLYKDAQVSLKFIGDMGDVKALPASAPVTGYWIQKGSASLEIVSRDGHRIKANFLDQLVISVDQTNGGAGFGSNVGGAFNPAYPLAIDGSNVGAFAGGVVPVPDLLTPGSWVDHAWSCIGFPVSSFNGGNGKCADPAAYPLNTDKGEFFIYQPYLGALVGGLMTDDYDGSVNDGVFSILPGAQ